MRLIDADALSKAMYDEAFENDESYNETNPMAKWNSGLWIRYKMFENTIDKIPTIEPKQGEWIEEIYIDGHTYGTCSNCLHIRIQDNYCPNCGAKMKEVDDE